MIRTADEYHALVSRFDQDRIDREIHQLATRLNPNGRLFKKLVKQNYERDV